MNGVGTPPPPISSRASSAALDGASARSSTAVLWSPAIDDPPTPPPAVDISRDSPLNLTTSGRTTRRISSPPRCPSPDVRIAAASVVVARRRTDDSPLRASSSPRPAHTYPCNLTKSENQTARKSTTISNHEVRRTLQHRNWGKVVPGVPPKVAPPNEFCQW